MKKLYFNFLLFFLFILFSCNDPIFYNISLEEELLEPMINGTPTNFAVFKEQMYVASGETLFRYSGHFRENNGAIRTDKGNWNDGVKIKESGKKIRILMLAATDSYLFALCEAEAETKDGKRVSELFLKKSSSPESGNFNSVITPFIILSIHNVNNQLFMGALLVRNTDTDTDESGVTINGKYGSLYILTAGQDGEDPIRLINTNDKLLNGAEYSNGEYYFSARNLKEESGCIYKSDLTLVNTEVYFNDIPFAGIINLGDNNNTIVAISNKGVLYNVLNKTDTNRNFGDHLATGALAIFEKNGNKLLLAGRQNEIKTSASSGYTYGYLELELDSNGISGSAFREPGNNTNSSMPSNNSSGENGKYKSSVGKISLNHIFQYNGNDDREKILFVSTQKNGIWSYRERKGSDGKNSWHWNAEQ
ncbi:MAG: hypothetical protein FWC19_04195 [Treponema sp.]|nr:hypothetical protein [Treponema sp.]MCL2271993.1 hypothetical protein [Treponema sp.]